MEPRKPDVHIVENFRTFEPENPMSFPTDIKCNICSNEAEQYMAVEQFYFCKSCIDEMVCRMDYNFQKYMKKGIRT